VAPHGIAGSVMKNGLELRQNDGKTEWILTSSLWIADLLSKHRGNLCKEIDPTFIESLCDPKRFRVTETLRTTFHDDTKRPDMWLTCSYLDEPIKVAYGKTTLKKLEDKIDIDPEQDSDED